MFDGVFNVFSIRSDKWWLNNFVSYFPIAELLLFNMHKAYYYYRRHKNVKCNCLSRFLSFSRSFAAHFIILVGRFVTFYFLSRKFLRFSFISEFAMFFVCCWFDSCRLRTLSATYIFCCYFCVLWLNDVHCNSLFLFSFQFCCSIRFRYQF